MAAIDYREIGCPTCRAKLRLRPPERAYGPVQCPNCGQTHMVAPPPTWLPGPRVEPPTQAPAPTLSRPPSEPAQPPSWEEVLLDPDPPGNGAPHP